MKTKFKKKKLYMICLMIIVILILITTTSVFASESSDLVGSSSSNIENKTIGVYLYLSKSSEYSINIPSIIVLNCENDDSDYIISYEISVNGGVSEKETIDVVPQDTVILRQRDKDDIVADVVQARTSWMRSNMGDSTIVSVFVKNPSAGSWIGNLYFNIGFKNNIVQDAAAVRPSS